MDASPAPELEPFTALVGTWETSASHPSLQGLRVPGSAHFEWLEGGRFLIGHSRNEHADFPDSLSVIGADDDGFAMHYYDSRGVERVYRTSLRDGVWRLWRDDPGFSQRFVGTFGDGGATIAGQWEASTDGATWDPDLVVTYRRAAND
jgi:hypothetical protein